MALLTPADAAAVAERHWHVHGQIDVLPSYLDQNFRIHAAAGDYVLKVAHPSWQRADLDLENHAMLALAEHAPRIAWPKVFFTPQGEHLLDLPLRGVTWYVRLLSFVPGSTWADVINIVPADQHATLHTDLGHVLARLDRGLATFRHPRADRPHPWNLMHLPELTGDVMAIADSELRQRVAAYMSAFTAALPSWHATLPKAVIHNDANDLNIIVARTRGAWHVDSLIDFGDMCTSFRIAELAIACTYAMPHACDALACAQAIVRGYITHNPLTHAELAALQPFIAARACQSIAMAQRAQRAQPDNAYITVSQTGMCTVLEQLAAMPQDAIVHPFLAAPATTARPITR